MSIGRAQTRDQTRDVLAYLRSKGVNALNLSALYGLPLQTLQSFRDTLEQVVDMAPDRLAITGYAHVPWMSKRQGAINEADLPIRAKRLEMAAIAQRFLTAQGYVAIGTDHFTKSNDSLHKAAQKGRVGRNFQGYTDDQCDTLIGIGASAISRFQQGYVQNAVATSAYQGRVSQTGLAGYKGYSMSRKDQFVARIIEDLLCGFTLRVDDLRQEFPDQTATIKATSAMLMQRYPDVFYVGNKGLVMQDWAKPLVRIIAQQVDQFSHPEIAHIAAI